MLVTSSTKEGKRKEKKKKQRLCAANEGKRYRREKKKKTRMVASYTRQPPCKDWSIVAIVNREQRRYRLMIPAGNSADSISGTSRRHIMSADHAVIVRQLSAGSEGEWSIRSRRINWSHCLIQNAGKNAMCVGYIKSIIHAVASNEIKSPHKKKRERRKEKGNKQEMVQKREKTHD